MMPGEETETVLTLDEQTIEEGEMWGRAMKDINRWVDASGRIKIKFIIYFLGVFLIIYNDNFVHQLGF